MGIFEKFRSIHTNSWIYPAIGLSFAGLYFSQTQYLLSVFLGLCSIFLALLALARLTNTPEPPVAIGEMPFAPRGIEAEWHFKLRQMSDSAFAVQHTFTEVLLVVVTTAFWAETVLAFPLVLLSPFEFEMEIWQRIGIGFLITLHGLAGATFCSLGRMYVKKSARTRANFKAEKLRD